MKSLLSRSKSPNPLPGQDAYTAQASAVSATPRETLGVETSIENKRSKARLGAIVVALCLALFNVALDQTITATAVPTISRDLHSASGYFWIGGAYLLAHAAACTIWARASDIWGRKVILLATLAWFFVASIIAAVSTSMRMLIAARALQGTAGGGIVQMVVITISDMFSVRQRALFIGLVEVVWAIAGGTGPLLGGALAQYTSWRWIFWINLPINGLSFGLLLIFLDVHNPRTRLREGLVAIDWFGTITIVGVIVMVLLGLDFGGIVFPWNSATVICLLVFGVVMIACFLFSEQRLARYPLMPLNMFKDWRNVAITVVLISHGLVYIGEEYYLPLYLQSAKEASPLRSGILVLPLTISGAAVGAFTGVVVHRTGRYREIIWIATLLMTLGTALFTLLGPNTSIATMAVLQVIAGIGVGPLFQTPIIAIQAVVTQADTASATSTFGFLRNVATSVSLVIGGVVFQNGMDNRMKVLKEAGVDNVIIEALSGSRAGANVDIISSIQDPRQKEAVKAAFAWSLRNLWIMYAVIAGVGFIASLFVVQQHLSVEHTETKTGIDHMVNRRSEPADVD